MLFHRGRAGDPESAGGLSRATLGGTGGNLQARYLWLPPCISEGPGHTCSVRDQLPSAGLSSPCVLYPLAKAWLGPFLSVGTEGMHANISIRQCTRSCSSVDIVQLHINARKSCLQPGTQLKHRPKASLELISKHARYLFPNLEDVAQSSHHY